MSTVLSAASGSWSSSSTWALANATAFLDSEAGTTATTTSYVYSSTFTPGAITVDGIAIKVSATAATGTFSVELFNNTDTVSVTSVTVNNTDLQVGWNFFKFSSSQLLIAAKAYKVGLKHTTSAVTVFRDATASNWSRALRTTTNQAPAAGDQILILGELTGAGTYNTVNVTMDNTATTSFGAIAYPQSICISNRGTLTWGVAGSTNYYLKVKGILDVQAGGAYVMGSSGSRIPTSSTAVLEFDCTANVDSGLRCQAGSTYSVYGAAKTRWTTMTADKIATNTVITLTDTTGWVAGDTLVFASTSRTTSQFESKTILTVDSGTQVTLTAGLTNAHTGTGNVKCEVMNLTSNLRIRGISTSLQGFISINTTSVGIIDNAEVYQMGSATANKRGIDIQTTTTGSVTFSNCAIHDFIVASSIGVNVTNSAANNFTLSGNALYNIANIGVQIAATTGTNYFLDSNLIISVLGGNGMTLSDVGGSFTNNVATACLLSGFALGEIAVVGTFSGNVAHSNSAFGITGISLLGATLATCKAYYNNSGGFNFETRGIIYVTSPIAFGNTTYNIGCNTNAVGSGFSGEVIVSDGTFDSSASFATLYGVYCFPSGSLWIFENCAFGATTAHSTATIFVSTVGTLARVLFRKCTFGEATRVSGQTSMSVDSYILSQRDQGTAGSHKGYFLYGNTTNDNSIYSSASPSLRLTPNNASNKLVSSPTRMGYRVAVASGNTISVSVKVRESVVGDGTDYNGSRIRLFVRKNVAIGITADTLLATATIASEGSFETLSGTTVSVTDDGVAEFYLDCDGTTGWINIDDFTSTTVNDSKGLKYWNDGLPTVFSDNVTTGGGGSSVVYYAY